MVSHLFKTSGKVSNVVLDEVTIEEEDIVQIMNDYDFYENGDPIIISFENNTDFLTPFKNKGYVPLYIKQIKLQIHAIFAGNESAWTNWIIFNKGLTLSDAALILQGNSWECNVYLQSDQQLNTLATIERVDTYGSLVLHVRCSAICYCRKL